MPLARSRFPDRSLPWTADLARRWQSWLREPLFLREVVVFDERFVVVGGELVAEKLLDKTDLG